MINIPAAKRNNVTVDDSFSVEVYPAEAVAGRVAEMYTLTPVKD